VKADDESDADLLFERDADDPEGPTDD